MSKAVVMPSRAELMVAEAYLRLVWMAGPKGGEEPTPSVIRRAAELLVAGDKEHACAILSRHAGCADAPPAVPGDPDYWPDGQETAN